MFSSRILSWAWLGLLFMESGMALGPVPGPVPGMGPGVATVGQATTAMEDQSGRPPSAVAQAATGTACRLWGRVTTVDGQTREGFLRWDRNGTHWADLLSGTRTLPPERVALVSSTRDPEAPPRRRVLEVRGYRVSWDEPDPALSVRTSAAIRFAHLASVQVFEGESALLTLNDGTVQEWRSDNSDLGSGMRGLVVTGRDGDGVTLGWDELDRVEFSVAPAGADPPSTRLHGTVEDRWGRSFSGWLAWDRDEALAADTLQGRTDGREYEIVFRDIVSMEAEADGTRVVLRDGRQRVLTGSNDVSDGHRGVQVTDPGLGQVLVPWDGFRRVRFHPPAGAATCGRVPPGPGAAPDSPPATLRGSVHTRDGRILRGAILWDGDEAAPWEHLDGEDRGVAFQVEMARIAVVRRRSFREAEVELRDGRVLLLGGSNDVSEDNRGILVRVGGDGEAAAEPDVGAEGDAAPDGDMEGDGGSGGWVLVRWNQLEEVRFERGA